MFLSLQACSLFVSKGDYRDYRSIRMADSQDGRLLAMAAYVRAHPGGHWADEVQAERARQDTDAYQRAKGDRAGIEHYLAAFPDGAFAAQARDRLSAIAVIEARSAQEQLRQAEAAEARKVHLQQQRRTWVSRFVQYWGKALSGLSNWGAPIPEVAQANLDFSGAFARSPRPRCSDAQCVKYYDAPYGMPVPGGTRVERTMRLVLRLHLREGRLEGADLLMPAFGFSRWSELEKGQLVVDEDGEQRQQAVAWAFDKLRGLVRGLAPAAELLPEGEAATTAIARLTLGPTGEQIDASVDDPAAPPNRIGVAGVDPPSGTLAPAAAAAGEQGGFGTDAAPDMVVGAIAIGAGGRVRSTPTDLAPDGDGDGGDTGDEADGEGDDEVMMMDALSIPTGGAAAPGGAPGQGPAPPDRRAPTGGPAPEFPLAAAPERLESYRVGSLRITLRAAPVDGSRGPHFDALLIRVASP